MSQVPCGLGHIALASREAAAAEKGKTCERGRRRGHDSGPAARALHPPLWGRALADGLVEGAQGERPHGATLGFGQGAHPAPGGALCDADGLPRRAELARRVAPGHQGGRSEEHTSELKSLMSISYAVFCL